MSEKEDKHLDFDLDFLGDKKDGKESVGKETKKSPKKKGEGLQNFKYGTQNFFGNFGKVVGVIAVIGFFIWIASSGDSSSSSSTPSSGSSSGYSSSSSCDESKLASLKPSTFEKSEVESLENSLNSSTVTEYSSQYLINQYNADLAEYNSKRDSYNAKVDAYNSYLNSYCK